jgi:hypothetical protein
MTLLASFYGLGAQNFELRTRDQRRAAHRGHWAIENTVHCCLDVTFREDERCVRERNLTNNNAWLKRFAISLLKHVPDKQSIAIRRRRCGWSNE